MAPHIRIGFMHWHSSVAKVEPDPGSTTLQCTVRTNCQIFIAFYPPFQNFWKLFGFLGSLCVKNPENIQKLGIPMWKFCQNYPLWCVINKLFWSVLYLFTFVIRYLFLEQHKIIDMISNWTCNICTMCRCKVKMPPCRIVGSVVRKSIIKEQIYVKALPNEKYPILYIFCQFIKYVVGPSLV